MLKPKFFALLFGLTLFTGTVFAQGKTTIIKKIDGEVVEVQMVDKEVPYAFNSFAESDADGDGRISAAEARDAGILSLAKVDRNGDGWLDEAEYQAAAFEAGTGDQGQPKE